MGTSKPHKSKTRSEGQKLISDLETESKNTLNKKKKKFFF